MIYFVATNGNDSHSGSMSTPWKTLENAINRVHAGDILYIRGGEYRLTEALVFRNKGTENQPIVYSAFDDEEVIIYAEAINFYLEQEKYEFGVETGALFLHQTAFIQIRHIKVMNSHGHGIAVRDSNNITIDNCHVHNTFCCGISLWDTHSTGEICHHNKIIGNTVTKATTWDMLPQGRERGHEPPHEAISIAGACHFEVCHNHVYNCDKEGIDVKEVSHHGTVHHNHVHHVDRQGLYADAWFGPLTHVDFYENTVHHCNGAGIVVSVEEGHCVSDVKIYNNNVFENNGSGILFGTWGADNPRYRIDIFNNTMRRNGHGKPNQGYDYHWITGGLCMLSANIKDCDIYNNIFEDNKGFEIGYSNRFIKENADIEKVLTEKNIRIFENIILPGSKAPAYPIHTSFDDSELYGLQR